MSVWVLWLLSLLALRFLSPPHISQMKTGNRSGWWEIKVMKRSFPSACSQPNGALRYPGKFQREIPKGEKNWKSTAKIIENWCWTWTKSKRFLSKLMGGFCSKNTVGVVHFIIEVQIWLLAPVSCWINSQIEPNWLCSFLQRWHYLKLCCSKQSHTLVFKLS